MAKRAELSKAEPIDKSGGSSGSFSLRPVPGTGQITRDRMGPLGNSAARYADATASLAGGGDAPQGNTGGWI